MGHSMSLFLVLATFYFSFRVLAKTAQPRREGGTWFGLLVLGLCGLAIFGSLMAAVRTAVFGLIVFWLGYGFFVYRKMLVAMLLVVAVATPLFGEKLVPVFFGDFERVAEGKWGAEELGSGRPRIWAGKLNAFAELPLDRQLAGIGVGARMAEMGVTSDSTRWLDSHNDFLEMLVELGAIGFVLTIALYCALLRQILTLTGWQKALFLSFFVSVVLMNFLSNSYISRFAIGQVFFLLMAYIELREPVQREHTQQRVGDDARS
jgi:O-antigen ligase